MSVLCPHPYKTAVSQFNVIIINRFAIKKGKNLPSFRGRCSCPIFPCSSHTNRSFGTYFKLVFWKIPPSLLAHYLHFLNYARRGCGGIYPFSKECVSTSFYTQSNINVAFENFVFFSQHCNKKKDRINEENILDFCWKIIDELHMEQIWTILYHHHQVLWCYFNTFCN